MPRKTRGNPEECLESIRYTMRVLLDRDMTAFLEVEAKRLSEQHGRKFRPPDIVRALIASYYEKRVAGMVTCPDD